MVSDIKQLRVLNKVVVMVVVSCRCLSQILLSISPVSSKEGGWGQIHQFPFFYGAITIFQGEFVGKIKTINFLSLTTSVPTHRLTLEWIIKDNWERLGKPLAWKSGEPDGCGNYSGRGPGRGNSTRNFSSTVQILSREKERFENKRNEKYTWQMYSPNTSLFH